MKNLSASFAKITAVVACALTLGSCNRAEYAMLPKSSSYHGVARASTPVPAKAEAPAMPAVADLKTAEPTVAPELVPAVASATPAPLKAATAGPASPVGSLAVPTQTITSATQSTVAVPVRKPNAIQRLALNKVTKKVDKLVQRVTARQYDNTVSTAKSGVTGNLRLGIILMVIGALIALLPGLFRLLGLIIFIVGVLFLLLWVLDQV